MHCGFFDGKMIQVVSGPEGSLGGEEMPGKTFRDGSSLIEANAMMIVELFSILWHPDDTKIQELRRTIIWSFEHLSILKIRFEAGAVSVILMVR